MQRDGAAANEEVYFAESYCQAMSAMAPVQKGDAAHQELRLADLGQTCSYLGLLELCGALSFWVFSSNTFYLCTLIVHCGNIMDYCLAW